MAKDGISVKLPLSYDDIDGPYELHKELESVIHQNLKNLILTEPGERVMDMKFGVGLKRLLFEPIHSTTYTEIKERIREQVATYMSFVGIKQIQIANSGPVVQVSIKFKLGDFEEESVLSITQVVD